MASEDFWLKRSRHMALCSRPLAASFEALRAVLLAFFIAFNLNRNSTKKVNLHRLEKGQP